MYDPHDQRVGAVRNDLSIKKIERIKNPAKAGFFP
jgi:hypothetical protein